MKENITQFQEALTLLNRVKAEELFDKLLTENSPLQVVEQMVVPALENIGQDWQKGELALSQIYMSGRLCEELVEKALPPSDPERKHQPRSAIVVLNDYHLLGKRIVYSVMRASGFEIFDYGRMDVNELVARVQTDQIRVLLISVLMLPSALKIQQVREALTASDYPVKILVGGAPFLFDPELWKDVGADAMGQNATDSVNIVETWMKEMS